MTTQLKLYNDALRELGERELASLSENREPRRLLDRVWDNNLIDTVLEQGQWNFASRTIQITFTPSVEPPFGYTRAFDKPTDWIRTLNISTDPYFRIPLVLYADEAQYWFCDTDEIYVSYVSSDASYGGDLSLWPESFAKYVSTYMAGEILVRLTQNKTSEEKLEKKISRRLLKAISLDSMNQPTAFQPVGQWVSSRSHGSRTQNPSRNGRGY